MPVAQPSPTEIIIYVKPYVRKFAVGRLSDPARMATDAKSRQLFLELERELHNGRKLVRVVNDFDPVADKANTRVRLLVIAPKGLAADVSFFRHRYVAAMLTRHFLDEMYSWVDWYCNRLGMGPRQALANFRKHYSITEEDHAFDTAERMYRFHRSGRNKRRRGR